MPETPTGERLWPIKTRVSQVQARAITQIGDSVVFCMDQAGILAVSSSITLEVRLVAANKVFKTSALQSIKKILAKYVFTIQCGLFHIVCQKGGRDTRPQGISKYDI